MSLIFDALQRSESERLGADQSELSAATDLLQLVERKAVSEWENAGQPELSHATEDIVRDTSVASEAVPPVVSSVDSLTDDKHLDQFAQFQSLVSGPPQKALVCLTDSESLAAEKFRFLGVRLRHLRRERPLKKILITSTIPHEGKSMVSANLACTLARKRQQRTLLVEGDLRRPAVSQMFGLGKLPGICESLQGQHSPLANIYHLQGPDLWILPAGNASSNPLELLQSARMSMLMDQLTTLFDWIIIDSPPVMPLADTSVWSRMADGILLVTRQGTTQKRQLERGLEALDHQKLIGALLNSSHDASHSDNYYYYNSSTASQSDNEPRSR